MYFKVIRFVFGETSGDDIQYVTIDYALSHIVHHSGWSTLKELHQAIQQWAKDAVPGSIFCTRSAVIVAVSQGDSSKKNKWREVSRLEFTEEVPTGAHVWISDGIHGFTKPLAEGETLTQAVEDFEKAGEPADEIIVYKNGEWGCCNKAILNLLEERTDL
jgi:hypothetical protein